MRELKPSDRLIVAADYDPRQCGGTLGAYNRLLELVDQLQGTGVIIKVGSILRASGYALIATLHLKGVKVMVDLKLIDIPNTMEFDAAFLEEYNPYLLTVMVQSTVPGMQGVQIGLGQRDKDTLAMISESSCTTEILGVTVLTSQGADVCGDIYRRTVSEAVRVFAQIAHEAGIGGLVLSGQEVPLVRELNLDPPLTLNTAGIRPAFTIVKGDDQDPGRITTPAEAIKSGVTRLVIGRPITQAGPNDQGRPQSPREAVELILQEIKEALSLG